MGASGGQGHSTAKEFTTDDRRKLRAEAEARFARDRGARASSEPSAALLHELQVHQIELEMQNEELRTTQVALEESRDGYLDLYEFAPVGYLALAESGLIREANLAACDLLGVERASLRGRRFAGFVVPESLASWGRLVSAVGSSANRSAGDLTLQRKDGSLLDCHLECLRLAGGDGATSMRIALIDVTEQRKAEAGLRMREALLTAILDGTADGILVVGSTGKILRANRRFQAMWKISDDMVSSGDDDTLLAHVIDQLADPEAFLAEVRRLYTSSEVCFDRVPLADGRVFERFSFPFSFGGPTGVSGRSGTSPTGTGPKVPFARAEAT